jgi:hypothetical protein
MVKVSYKITYKEIKRADQPCLHKRGIYKKLNVFGANLGHMYLSLCLFLRHESAYIQDRREYKKSKNALKNVIEMYLQSYKNQVEEDHVQLELQLWSGQRNK